MVRVIAVMSLLVMALALPLNGSQAQEDPLTIIASTSILADVIRNVAGDAAVVETLFAPGVNAHTAEPSAQDIARLSDADAVMTVGLGYESSLLPILSEADNAGDFIFYEVSGCVPLLPVMMADAHAGEDDHAAEAPADRRDGEADMDERCADHAAALQAVFGVEQAQTPGALGRLGKILGCDAEGTLHSCDPHVWTDPINVGYWTLMIRDMLSAQDPANAETYAANAEAYLAELAALDADIRTLIESIPPNNRFMITNHATFNYFAARYGLTIIGVIIPGGSTTAEPSVQEVTALIQTVQDYDVPAIFTDNVIGDSLAQEIAAETGAQIIQLYTDSLSAPDGGASTYLDYMRFNATALAEALQ